MSLKEVILEIAEEMEGAGVGTVEQQKLTSFAKQLRRAVKAAPDTPEQPIQFPSNRELINAAREEFRGKVPKIDEEQHPLLVNCEGGRVDGSMLEIASDMPQGSKTLVAGQVYVLTGNTLRYSEEETRKLDKRMS